MLLSGGFITIFDLFVVNIAIPSMQRTLDASFAQINFIIVACRLAYGVLLIAGSRLGDRLGRRRLFVLGMLGFALTSALCGLAPDANALICARALQGVAAAMLFPQVYALIRVSYGGHARRRAFGLLGMTLGLAAIAGQVLGGWIVHADLFGLSWRVIFLVNVPLGLAAWKLARHLPESREPSASSMDWPGAALAGLGLGLLMLALIEGPARHWPAWTLASAMLAVAALALFVRAQLASAGRRRAAGGHDPADAAALRHRLPAGAAGVLDGRRAVPVLRAADADRAGRGRADGGFHLRAGQRGLRGRLDAGAATGGAPRHAGHRAGRAALWRRTAALMLQVGAAGGALSPWSLVPVLVWLGAAQGAVNTPLVNLTLGLVPDHQAGMAAGVVSTLQQVGAALGVAAAGMLFSGALEAGAGAAAGDRYAQAFASAAIQRGRHCAVGAAAVAAGPARLRPGSARQRHARLAGRARAGRRVTGLRMIGVDQRQLDAVTAVALGGVQRATVEEHHIARLQVRADRARDPGRVQRLVVAEEFLGVELGRLERRRMRAGDE